MEVIDIFEHYKAFVDEEASECNECGSEQLKISVYFDTHNTRIHQRKLYVPLMLEIECEECGLEEKKTIKHFCETTPQSSKVC